MTKSRTTKEQTGSELLVAHLSDTQLVAIIQKHDEEVVTLEALKELNRRRSTKAPKLMATVVGDASYTADLRAIAAVELGKQATTANRRALMRALGAKEPIVVRRVAEALGRVGDQEAMEALARLRPRSEEARRSVAFGRALISYRLGLDRYGLQPIPEESLLRVRADQAMTFQPQAVSATELDELSEKLERVLPSISVSREGALRFACGKNRFLILFHDKVHGWKTLAPLKEQNAVVAVVLKRSKDLHGYFVYEYILTEPSGREGLRVFGVRPSGVVTHYGSATLAGQGADVSLRTVDTPYTPPIDLKLSYRHDMRSLEFATALMYAQSSVEQKRPRAPRRLTAPDG